MLTFKIDSYGQVTPSYNINFFNEVLEPVTIKITQDGLPEDIKLVVENLTGRIGFYDLTNDRFIPIEAKNGLIYKKL